jgi:hypothetical protein
MIGYFLSFQIRELADEEVLQDAELHFELVCMLSHLFYIICDLT